MTPGPRLILGIGVLATCLTAGCSSSRIDPQVQKPATSISQPKPFAVQADRDRDDVQRADDRRAQRRRTDHDDRMAGFRGPGAATIENTGSTNTYGYRILVSRYGHVVYTNGTRHGQDDLPDALSAKFFSDLQAASPLSRQPQGSCVKSASFGTYTTVTYQGQRSPDISCPANRQQQALYDDVLAIDRYLNVTNYPKRPIQ